MKNIVAGYLHGDKGEGVMEGKGQDNTYSKLAFLIDGKIKQEPAQSLFETQPLFQQTVCSCHTYLQQFANLSLLENSPSGQKIRTINTPGLLDDALTFTLHFSLLKLWEAWGIRPHAVLGSQTGELVAACASGIMEMETAFSILLKHGGVKGNIIGSQALQSPQLRIISGSSGRSVEKQEALSSSYWEHILREQPNREKGIDSLHNLGYTHFLKIGLRNDFYDDEELFTNADLQCHPSITEEDPWKTLTLTLANLYCLGLDIDWSGFDQGYSRQKVILPTYPFQRKYFWRETATDHLVSQREIERSAEETSRAHPLDGKLTNSSIQTKQIEYSLSLDDMPDVKDTHGVLHVGHFMEILHRAVKNSYQRAAFHLQSIDFLTALIIPDQGTANLSLTLDTKKSGQLDFSIFSQQAGEQWHKHAQGTILLESTSAISAGDLQLRSAIISRCRDQYAGTEFYHRVQERGLFLGESVQWLGHIWSREEEALGLLSKPCSLSISHDYAMGLHPGILDACAQLFHAALPKSVDKDMRYMVTRWENFTCQNQPLDQALWCHVVLQDSVQANLQIRGTIQLFNQNGTVIAEVRNNVMKGINQEREEVLKKYLAQSETMPRSEGESEVLSVLRGLNQDQQRSHLHNYLQRLFATILQVAVDDLSLDEPLMDIGIDSIVSMEARQKLEEELGISLPIEQLLVGPSITELTESIFPLLAGTASRMEREIREAALPAYKMDIPSWIVHRKSNPQARVKLFCFPYGGGPGASLYRGWQAMLPDSVEVCPVQLPGKENRVQERAFTDVGRATEVLKEVLLPELDRPYAFYGHSVGAFLAYRLAYKLWREIENKPAHLFVGAYISPTILPNSVIAWVREKFQERGYDDIPAPESLSSIAPEKTDEIAAILNALSSISTEWHSLLIIDPELQRLLLPARLAEFQMIRDYKSRDTVLFDVPITAFHGKMDGIVRKYEMAAWQELTQGPFAFHTLPGNHFFLHKDQDQKQLLQLLSRDLEKEQG